MEPKFTYINLLNIIPETMSQVDFQEYHTSEQTLIKPALEAQGYRDVQFRMGERDSFGPLSRIVLATRKDDTVARFIYG